MISYESSRTKGRLTGRLLAVVLGGLALAAPAEAGQIRATAQVASGFGAPCVRGQYSLGGYLLVCSATGTFRYALPEDVPPAPLEGYVKRPAWYPPLADVFRSINPPKCPLSGRVTFTSPIVRLDDLSITVPQGVMVGDHVTPIDHGYIGVKPLGLPRAARTEADYVRV